MALKVIGKILEWGYPQIIHLMGFSIINLPFLGYAHLWKPSYRQFGSFRSPVSAVFAVAGHDNWDTFAVWLVMGRRLGIIKWMVWHCFCRRTTKPRKTLISFNIKIGIWTVVCFPNVFLLLIPNFAVVKGGRMYFLLKPGQHVEGWATPFGQLALSQRNMRHMRHGRSAGDQSADSEGSLDFLVWLFGGKAQEKSAPTLQVH